MEAPGALTTMWQKAEDFQELAFRAANLGPARLGALPVAAGICPDIRPLPNAHRSTISTKH
jgi:hypothetical protein